MQRALRTLAAIVGLSALAALGSCVGSRRPAVPTVRTDPVPLPSMADAAARDYAGVHNAVAFHPGFVSGSAPEGDAGFDTLQGMGIRTIISVDGAEPDVERARARGIRYIHLPIGYNGFDEPRKLQLARATRDAMKEGPVYIHCHHGKHRSAGAAATIAASLGWQTAERGVERMRVSGTALNYTGLYACASAAMVISDEVVDRVPADFPPVWQPTGFVKGMVEIDTVLERLKEIEKAGWVSPREHPDLVPVAEAGRLADLHRVLIDSGYVKRRPPEFAAMMRWGYEGAQRLEDLLVEEKRDGAALSAQLQLVAASCRDCHVKYRD